MKQKIKAILDDEKGVSPVIGVILMVAITVILAAVIGTFVLGLGDSLQQAPQAQLEASSNGANSVTISHNGGDALTVADVKVTIGTNSDLSFKDDTSSFSSDEFAVGDSANFTESSISGGSGDDISGSDIQVTVIHEPSESILLDTEVDVGGTSP